MPCHNIILLILLFFALTEPSNSDDSRRPIYIFGHAANTIEYVIPHLDNGANALESDVHFFPNGSVKEVVHGCDEYHDCNMPCGKSVKLHKYFKYLRHITDPCKSNSYHNKLIMQMLDLKLFTSKNFSESGRDIARHVLDHLWSNGDRPLEVKIVFYFDALEQKEAAKSFIQEFKDRKQESRLKDVGFDGGTGNITAIGELVKEMNLENFWIGDGILNCLKPFYPVKRLKEAVSVRKIGGYIKKVYDWTVDYKYLMRKALDSGVDGIITNYPKTLIEVLNEKAYRQNFRPATQIDHHFERFS